MGDIIEASEDGGFDIPTTSVTPPSSRLANLPPKEDPVQPRPRRIRIQLEDDDDDDDDDDSEGQNDGERNPGASTATALTDAGRSEKGLGSPAVDRPKYRVYKVETRDEDPVLEIVVSLVPDSTAAPISTAATTAKAKRRGVTGAPQAQICPFVNIASDGKSIVVEHNNPEAKGGGNDGATNVRGRFTLNLPQKVVPSTAMSFFWEGDLTIRAALAGIE